MTSQIVSTMAASTFSPEKPSPVKLARQHRQSYQPLLDDTLDIDESTLGLSIYQPRSTRHLLNEQSFLSSSPRESLARPLGNLLTDKTRKEDLLLSSDYNSVFKSRPKIAVSPPFTPSGGSPSILPDLSLVSGMKETPKRASSKDGIADIEIGHASSPLLRGNSRRGKM